MVGNRSAHAPVRRRWLAHGLLLVSIGLFTFVAGCGPAGPGVPTGTVQGKVTKGGSGVPGQIFFSSADGHAASGKVEADGSYTLVGEYGEKIPVGEYRVSISPTTGGGDIAAAPTSTPGGGVVPPKYLSADSSGWTAPVKEGKNTFDFVVE
jgi:hypothetical protein